MGQRLLLAGGGLGLIAWLSFANFQNVAPVLITSRSEALAWCVELVAEHESDWIDQLRDALRAVEDLRDSGPSGH